MWNQLLDYGPIAQRARRKQYNKHVQSLMTIRSQVNTKAPFRPQFLEARSKQKVMEIEKEANIRQQNSLLVKRMLNLKQGFLGEVRFLSSLSRPAKQRNNFRIRNENNQLVKKLITITSDYDCRRTLKETAKLQALAESISKHRSILDVADDYRQLQSAKQGRRTLQSSKTIRTLRNATEPFESSLE